MSGIGQWSDIRGRVLVLANSPVDSAEADAVVDHLGNQPAVASVSVIAPLGLCERLGARGITAGDLLAAADRQGRDLEFNFFLEQFEARQWILERRCDVVLCTAGHSLYNEEVKHALELRVAAFMGASQFVTHALPSPYVYFLDRSDVIGRQGRPARIKQYLADTGALVADLHAKWIGLGKPPAAEVSSPLAELTIRTHLTAVAGAESDPPPPPPARTDAGVAVYGAFEDSLWERALKIMGDQASELDRRHAEIDRRDQLLAEVRIAFGQEVERRDRRIAELMANNTTEIEQRDQRTAELIFDHTTEIERRDRHAAELIANHTTEIERRDRCIADGVARERTEIERRDQRLTELIRDFTTEIEQRDRRIAELADSIGHEISIRDAIITRVVEQQRTEAAQHQARIAQLQDEVTRLTMERPGAEPEGT